VREDDEGGRHKRGEQFASAQRRVRFLGADELRPEGDAEDRQLGAEQVDGDRVDDDATSERRVGGAAIEAQIAAGERLFRHRLRRRSVSK
jgi:hypothetical protein